MAHYFNILDRMNSPWFDLADSPMHVNCWLTLDTVAWNRSIAGQGPLWNLSFKASTQRLYFVRYNQYASPGREAASGVVLSANTWYHVAAGYDGTNSYIAVNGEARNTYALGAAAKTGGWTVVIGGLAGIVGNVAEFALFNDTFAAADDARLYAGGTMVKWLPLTLAKTLDLYCPLDNLYAYSGQQRTTDHSGNDRHMSETFDPPSLVGAPVAVLGGAGQLPTYLWGRLPAGSDPDQFDLAAAGPLAAERGGAALCAEGGPAIGLACNGPAQPGDVAASSTITIRRNT